MICTLGTLPSFLHAEPKLSDYRLQVSAERSPVENESQVQSTCTMYSNSIADAMSIIARLLLMPKSDIASQTMIDFQFSKKKKKRKKKKIRLGRIKHEESWGQSQSVSQRTSGWPAWSGRVGRAGGSTKNLVGQFLGIVWQLSKTDRASYSTLRKKW